MMMRALKYSCYIFCGLKSYIRFYSKLTFIEPALFKIVVLPYNAGNRQQPPQKKYNLPRWNEKHQRVERRPFRMKDCSQSFFRLICNSLSDLLSSSQSLFLVFFTDKPLKISLEYFWQICRNRFFLSLTGRVLRKN